jgi:hypothetical protein
MPRLSRTFFLRKIVRPMVFIVRLGIFRFIAQWAIYIGSLLRVS